MEGNILEKIRKTDGEKKILHCGKEISNAQCNSLLCLFSRFAWDEHDDPYPGCKDIGLGNWISSEGLNFSDEFWHLSNRFDIRVAEKIEMTNDLKLNEDFLRKAHNLNRKRTCARLAYYLRKILPTLVACNNDVNYKDDAGQTLLHIFIDRYLKKTDNFPEEQIIKIQQLMEGLVKIKAPFLANNKNNKTPLCIAASCKSKEVIEIILSSMTDLDACGEYGNSVLHWIVANCVDNKGNHKEGYLNLVQSLISTGLNPNSRDKDGVTPVHLAASTFHIDMLKLFVDNGGDCCQRANDDRTSLHFTCNSALKLHDSSKYVETFEFLLSQGCDIEAVDEEGCKPIHNAAEFGPVEIVERLIELGASIHCRTGMLITPLYLASKTGRLDVIRKLIEAGADVNAEALDGTTPIFVSVMCGSFESMEYLMQQGADITVRDDIVGFTLLHVAVNDLALEPEYDESDDVLEVPDDGDQPIEFELFASALEEPVDVKKLSKLKLSDSALEKLVNNKQLRKLNALMDKGFYINDSTSCGISPLQLASIRGNVDIVRILIECGADVHYRSDRSALTALHLAVIRGNIEIAKILLDNGSDINCRGGTQQWTPLYFAMAETIQWNLGKYRNNTESYMDKSYIKFWPNAKARNLQASSREKLVRLLLNYGAEVNIRDTTGQTPLHLASLKTNKNMMYSLIYNFSKVNVPDYDGRLPLHNVLDKGNAEGMHLLVDSGVEINDDDIATLIINSKDEVKTRAIHHAIRRKLLGLPINKIYETLICAPEYAEFYAQCSLEAQITINTNRATNTLEDLKALAPLYYSVMVGGNREYFCRMDLLKSARIVWTRITNIYLPDICVDKILFYLNNRCLETFIICTTNDSDKIIIDKKTKYVISKLYTYTC